MGTRRPRRRNARVSNDASVAEQQRQAPEPAQADPGTQTARGGAEHGRDEGTSRESSPVVERQPRVRRDHGEPPAPGHAVEQQPRARRGHEEPPPEPRRRRRSRRGRAPSGPDGVARSWFGIERLRPEQASAIAAVVGGRDAMAVLPTGYGKSLIYQVPALMIDRPTVVVSPLLALMRDQERGLRQRGVPVVRLDSTLRAVSRRQALARIRKGGRYILLTTPETLEAEDARAALGEARPQLLCIDEAHCISEWGHDFRPAYLRLGTEREQLGFATTLALTATATPHVRQDIAERLGMQDLLEVVAPPDRDNLSLGVELVSGDGKLVATAGLLKRLAPPGIVYCSTTKAVDDIFGALTRAGIPCARYHGRMRTPDRNAAQRRFMGERRLVMVATSAFGMGIDKRDIRYVLHYQAPGSLEQYVQEAGRAGRDGKAAHCILLFDEADLAIQEHLQGASRPKPAQLSRVTEALAAWIDEAKPVSVKDLAFSASVTQVACRSMCAELEKLQLITLGQARRYAARVPAETLRAAGRDLAARFETLRTQDRARLRAVAEYAGTTECRSIVIRRYFGAGEAEPCGRCDNCRRAAGESPEPRAAAGDILRPKRRARPGRGRGRPRPRAGSSRHVRA